MPDRIEQQIVISAPLDRVWDLVSVPGWWVPAEVEAEPDRTPGSRTVRESARWGRFPVEVVELRPQLKDNTGGWSEELGSLRTRAEEPASA